MYEYLSVILTAATGVWSKTSGIFSPSVTNPLICTLLFVGIVWFTMTVALSLNLPIAAGFYVFNYFFLGNLQSIITIRGETVAITNTLLDNALALTIVAVVVGCGIALPVRLFSFLDEDGYDWRPNFKNQRKWLRKWLNKRKNRKMNNVTEESTAQTCATAGTSEL